MVKFLSCSVGDVLTLYVMTLRISNCSSTSGFTYSTPLYGWKHKNGRFVYGKFSGVTYLSEISKRLRSWIKIRVLGRHR